MPVAARNERLTPPQRIVTQITRDISTCTHGPVVSKFYCPVPYFYLPRDVKFEPWHCIGVMPPSEQNYVARYQFNFLFLDDTSSKIITHHKQSLPVLMTDGFASRICFIKRWHSHMYTSRAGVNSAPELDFLANSKVQFRNWNWIGLTQSGRNWNCHHWNWSRNCILQNWIRNCLPWNWNPIWGPSYISGLLQCYIHREG